MPIFELGDDAIREVERTTLKSAGLKEREDLQRLLRDHVEVVAPNVLVIAEEFGEWTDSKRRIDLLGVDRDANLVVIELKRTEDGGHMELQALRYAAMVSALTAKRAVEVFGKYLKQRNKDDDPHQTLLDFLDWGELDEDQFGQDVRIILVSAGFSRELTTAVLWLNDKDLDIRCVRMQPYRLDERTLVNVQQVLPLPESADYQVQVREKKRQERESRKNNADHSRFDVTVGTMRFPNQWKRNAILLVVKGLVRNGVHPLKIADALRGAKGRRAWRVIGEETTDTDRFREVAELDALNSGRPYDDRRWHTRSEDLIAVDGKTYAFTNQWGRTWVDGMAALQSTFPQLGIDWTPSGVS